MCYKGDSSRGHIQCERLLKANLRALDSISLLSYVVTTQMQFDFRFSSTAGYCLAAKFYFSYRFSFRVFFQSRKRVLQ